ncbi:hypothetical protein BZA77DRAFT_363053 [Pyronema omphalodes]|nr:hypothetical protein BZA77DRAFT_363053 [Pyronema omphalodes]
MAKHGKGKGGGKGGARRGGLCASRALGTSDALGQETPEVYSGDRPHNHNDQEEETGRGGDWDTPLPDAPSTAPAETDGWKTVEAKATQKKKTKAKETTSTAAIPKQTPTTKNGGRGKNTHRPRTTTPSAKKTWAEVVKSGGINVQIVLGNGNLGLTTPPTRRGERRGGATRRLRKKEGEGERGEERRGRAGPGVSKGKESETPAEELREERRVGGVGGPAAVQLFFGFVFALWRK